jgi:hypothetical protein
MVRVEVRTGQRPVGLRQIHDSALKVGRAGVVVGNQEYRLAALSLRCGNWLLEIWVDAELSSEIGTVVFALPTLS